MDLDFRYGTDFDFNTCMYNDGRLYQYFSTTQFRCE